MNTTEWLVYTNGYQYIHIVFSCYDILHICSSFFIELYKYEQPLTLVYMYIGSGVWNTEANCMSIPVIKEVRPGSLPWFLYLLVCVQDDDCMGM